MQKTKINLDESIRRGGEYSHGVSVNMGGATLVFTSNQIAVDARGEALYENDPKEQARYVIEVTDRILNEVGAGLADIVKTIIYITDMSYFPDVSDVWDEYFKSYEPASSLVEVKSIGHPSCIVGIEVVAVVDKKHKRMKIIDLSPELYTNMPVYPGDPEVRIQQVHTLKNEGWRLRYIEMPSHIGAHVDAFSHMDENGKTLSELPIERFIGETIKVQLEDEFPFSVGLMFGRGELDIVLLDKLVRANPGFVVVGDKATLTVELERQLLQKGIITITDLINLDQLPFDQVFTLYAVPLNIKDGDGSPVRAFAIVE